MIWDQDLGSGLKSYISGFLGISNDYLWVSNRNPLFPIFDYATVFSSAKWRNSMFDTNNLINKRTKQLSLLSNEIDKKRLKFLERQLFVSNLSTMNPKYLEVPGYYMKRVEIFL